MPVHLKDPRVRLLHRHENNPILTAHQWPYFVNTVFNAGATRLPSGETLLLCRVEDCSGCSHFCVARSRNGVDDWQIEPHPTMIPDVEGHPEEIWGIEDPRITWLSDRGEYAVAYTAYSSAGPGVSLALTRDFQVFQRLGNIMPPEDKDAALLPRQFNGRWVLIHRPVPASGHAHIWASYSPDLRYWGDHRVILKAKRGSCVGRPEDRPRTATHRNEGRLAYPLPRRATNCRRLPVSPRPGAV